MLLGLMVVACHLGLLHMCPVQLWLKSRVPWRAWTSGRLRIVVFCGCGTTQISSAQSSTPEPVAHKPIGAGSISKGLSTTAGAVACIDSYRQHVCGLVHKSPRRCAIQGAVQASSESPAMGGSSFSLHQSSTHPLSPELRSGHAFEERDSSRRVEVAAQVSLDDLDSLRESEAGSVRHERECALPAVSRPAGGGCSDIALASSQTLRVSPNRDLAAGVGVMQDQGGGGFGHTFSPELAEPALVPGPGRAAGGTTLADTHQEGSAISSEWLSMAPEPGIMETSCVAASGMSEELSALHSHVLDTLSEVWPSPSWNRVTAHHSRIIKNGQIGGTWVELVAEQRQFTCHSSDHALNYAEL
ncbi:DNA ligase [Labeo rohita]|uniref:DNA ligase n=1 Tax=Labeo rohita TaxID=84645 RepID=A0ABQ8KYS4_LABRO|nr:DNA ligase [Labeo rohita]